MLEQVDSIPIIHAFDFTLYFYMMTEQENQENQENNDELEQADSLQDTKEEREAPDLDAERNDLESELIAAQEEIAKLKDAFLRAKAEEDNVRRRSEKEIASSRKFAVEGFAKEMLNVRDSLQMACNVEVPEGADESVKSVHDGVEVTLKQLDSAFNRFSLTEINPEVGAKVDPNLHQAMSMVESDDVESGGIISVIQVGFQLHDRLLRPAMVVVSK